jgi:BirA family biotin operon repressor/biotin-[acetyl-CoA-carboxylase] ligase
VPWLAIGIGINLARAPKETAFPATSIAAVTGYAPARDTAVNRLVEHWDRWFARWTAEGFPPVRDTWLARAARLGDKIAARSGEMEIVGVFESLDSDGALLLREPSGALSRISAGEVFFA